MELFSHKTGLRLVIPVAFALSLGLSGCSYGPTSPASPPTRGAGDVDYQAIRNAVPTAEQSKQIEKETAADNAAELASFKAMQFSEAKSASVAKLAELTDGKGRFHGYNTASEWLELDDPSRAKLASSLKQSIVATLMPFCVPHFGYAVHLETDNGTRDFLICLECGIVEAFDSAGHRVRFELGPDELIKLKACYLDEFILGIGLKRKA